MTAFFWYQKLTLFYFSSDTPVIYKSLIIQAGVTPSIFFGHKNLVLFVLLHTFLFV